MTGGRGGPAARTVPPPGAVYGIADVDALGDLPPAAAAAAMARAGVRWVQLRAKRLSDADLYRHAVACREALEDLDAFLWIDDRPDVAALAAADGVHLGQDDLPPRAARRVVGPRCAIGRSTHDREQLLEADADPEVDVIAVGPVFATAGKEAPDPVVGLDHVRWARRATRKPLVAIGGIDASNVAQVLSAGADAVAVIGAVCRPGGPAAGPPGDADGVESNARRLLAAADRRKEARA